MCKWLRSTSQEQEYFFTFWEATNCDYVIFLKGFNLLHSYSVINVKISLSNYTTVTLYLNWIFISHILYFALYSILFGCKACMFLQCNIFRWGTWYVTVETKMCIFLRKMAKWCWFPKGLREFLDPPLSISGKTYVWSFISVLSFVVTVKDRVWTSHKIDTTKERP